MPEVLLSEYLENFTFPVKDYYRWLGLDLEKEPFELLAVEWIEEYERRRFECELQDGAYELLGDLYQKNIHQAVLSAHEHDTLLQSLEYYAVLCCFTDIVGLSDIYAASKIENGKKYISRLAVDPSEVLFVGDTRHDFDVAQSMGVNCVLVAGGHNSKARLATCGVPVFDSLYDVRNHIRELIV